MAGHVGQQVGTVCALEFNFLLYDCLQHFMGRILWETTV